MPSRARPDQLAAKADHFIDGRHAFGSLRRIGRRLAGTYRLSQIVEPAALKYIESDVMWEHAPMESLAAAGQLVAYRHEEFWQCMDTLRDLRYLESLWDAGRAPWKTW